MDFGERKSYMPLRKSDANFQGIRSHVILAVTLHCAHLAQCSRLARSGVVCPGRIVILEKPRLPRMSFLDPGIRRRDQTETRLGSADRPFGNESHCDNFAESQICLNKDILPDCMEM